mgnify:CR=1 FL=1
MKNILTINNHKAVVSFDPDINMFRGEFADLNGGSDFYSDTVEGLYQEGVKSLEGVYGSRNRSKFRVNLIK